MKNFKIWSCLLITIFTTQLSFGQATIVVDTTTKFQIIDGFGSHQSGSDINNAWWISLFYDDLEASIYRVDLTPKLINPFSNLSYFSPWFMGSATTSIFNLEDNNNPNGPENNRVRTYTGPNDYSRSFGGQNAPIAVMGPDINENIKKFQYAKNDAITIGQQNKSKLGDFKLIGSLWSPVPWVKVSSGNKYGQNWWPGPVQNTPWPFVWGGNFAGGKLDVSNVPMAVFNDGIENTTSLTQFARSTAAYISGYQKYYGVNFYAISIQNELNFEQFYNSATYPLSSQYIAAVKVVRAEFDKYNDLKNIKIMGPEDLLGGDAYGMWQYGGGNNTIHKNLQYLKNIEADATASKAVEFYCIHGYAADGVSSAGASPNLWNWWVNGWTASPAAGIPGDVKGFNFFNKKSWMTETSGENNKWLFPATGFPNDGGFSIAMKIHQALVQGNQSAWIYWTFTEADDNGLATNYSLTSKNVGNASPKYVGAKHFFKHIRPDSRRIKCTSSDNTLWSSSYINHTNQKLTTVIINTSNSNKTTQINLGSKADELVQVFTSSNNQTWVNTSLALTDGNINLTLTPYSVVTLVSSLPKSTSTSEIEKDELAWKAFFSNGQLNVELEDELFSKSKGLELYDINGRLVQSFDQFIGSNIGENKKAFDVSHLTSGYYILHMDLNGNSYSKKLRKD